VNGQNDHVFGLEPEIDCVWEAGHDSATRLVMHAWKGQGIRQDSLDELIGRSREPASEASGA
jgi:hypothetical protein